VELHGLDAPCPACGGTRQNATVQAPTVPTTTAVPTPRILIGYNPDRTWYSRWRGVRQHLEKVEAGCRPGAYRGNEPVKRDFENLFTQCFHLGDWLWEDKSTGLTDQQVRTFIDKDAALRICAGVANTSKHRTRRQPNAITARIASVGFDDQGTHVTIDWSEGLHGEPRTRSIARGAWLRGMVISRRVVCNLSYRLRPRRSSSAGPANRAGRVALALYEWLPRSSPEWWCRRRSLCDPWFELEGVEGGTQMRVTESGFDRLPPERRDVAYRGNADGWTAQLQAIQAYVG
jgi:hypothetical protein